MPEAPKLPPLPEPEPPVLRHTISYSEQEMHAYGLACWEAGRAKWEPIETAPRAKVILLWGQYWNKLDWFEKPLPGYWNQERDCWEAVWMNRFCVHPTHWQPLPQPPDTNTAQCGARRRSDSDHS